MKLRSNSHGERILEWNHLRNFALLEFESYKLLSVAPSHGINEDVVEDDESNHFLVNLIASPIIFSDSNVDVNDGELVISDDFAPLELGH
ncbi:hypothetical protein MA16_Dca026913 [Dendrobium catenatum]|uniref:Uncharacterized protein n=1 Tax=Dendrobium catenatum TaxID=906689 RepID=A0A2I0WHT3_9ASPA|nr:hypothetical protein MA16_Dca026913 [Dendrobium catenatum]